MNRNKHGPNLGFTASRGDPDIGRFKRGRAPCPSALITLLTKRKAGVADGLDANAMAGIKAPEWEENAQFSMFNDQLSMRYIDVYQLIEHCALKNWKLNDIAHCTLN